MKQQIIDQIHSLLNDFNIVELKAIYTALFKLSGRSDGNGNKRKNQVSNRPN